MSSAMHVLMRKMIYLLLTILFLKEHFSTELKYIILQPVELILQGQL